MLRPLPLLSLLLSSAALAAPLPGNTISGQVIDWPAGQKGELTLPGRDDTDLARAAVNPDGSFQLALPTVGGAALHRPDALFGGPKCTSSFPQQTPGVFLVNLAELGTALPVKLADGTSGDVRLKGSALRFAPNGAEEAVLFYAGGDLQGTFEIACPEGVTRFLVDVKAGWNLGYLQNGVAKNGQPSTTLSSTPGSAPLAWRLFDEFGGIGVTLDTKAAGPGVKVQEVRPDGPAARAGLRQGDVILTVEGQEVRTPESVVQRAVGAPNTPVRLRIRRGTDTLDFTLTRNTIRVP